MATAAPPMAPQIPSAAFRRSGETAALRSVKRQGHDHRPSAPLDARAATSTPMDGASAATADAAVKTAMPRMKIRRRPNRSPMAAARQEQDGEGQRVGVDRPFQAGQPGVEVDPDHRQCRRHHQIVERGHEEGQPGDDHGPRRASGNSGPPRCRFGLFGGGSRRRAHDGSFSLGWEWDWSIRL